MMLKQKQFSKKINYDALNNLFPGAKVVGGGSGKSNSHKSGNSRKMRKRGRQDSSDESSSSSDDDNARARNSRKGAAAGKKSKSSQGTGQGYFESDNNDSQAEIIEEDGEMLPPSHPLRRKETRLNKRGQASSAAEESQGTDLGEDMDEWGEEAPLDLDAQDMRRKLGYFDNDTMDDDDD